MGRRHRSIPEAPTTTTTTRSPPQDGSFFDLLQVRQTVSNQGDDVFATWYGSTGEATNEYTFGQLWEEAGVISHYIRNEWGLKKGDRAVLCYNFGLHFFAAFLGCLRAGVVAVLVYPPIPPLSQSLPKMNKVIANCDAKLILTDSDVIFAKRADKLNPFSKSRQEWPEDSKFQVTDKLRRMFGRNQKSLEFDEVTFPDELAFLQYTSGSTGDPKGVMVTFGALSANVDLIHAGYDQFFREDGGAPDQIVGFSWLPQYHDLGLIYAIIAPFVGGWRMHVMSPVDFIKNPLLWLELMSRHRVHWGVAPDFAFNLVARKFVHAREKLGRNPIPGLDLSCLRNLQNGTEPVKRTTRDTFGKVLAPYGLRENWFHAGYGLAENVVGVCWVHEYHLSSPREEDLHPLVAVGSRKTFHSSLVMKVVDPETLQEMPDGETGELWIAGPSVAAGYFGKPDLSREVFGAKMTTTKQTFLRTGDLAFFQNDYLYICGRSKDLIIINGANYYPQDIEYAVQDASPAVRPGCVAAFSSSDTGSDHDGLQVVFEIRAEYKKDAAAVVETVRRHILQENGLAPSRVVAIRESTIPKTTSGKIRRRACRKSLREGTLQVVFDWTKTDHQGIGADKDEDLSDLEESIPLGGDNFDQIVCNVLGSHKLDSTVTWDEIGLSSMVSLELRDAIDGTFRVVLPPDCFDLYPTPDALKSYIERVSGKALPVNLPKLCRHESQELSWLFMSVSQALGVVLLLCLFTLAIIPAYYVGSAISSQRTDIDAKGSHATWFWIPLTVPTWMVGFTLLVVVAKWIVVGRYREGEMSIPSFAYVRWWWVDRAVHLWEFWIGRFVQDTPLLWVFYHLMGVKVHPSAKIDAFIREFDLVEIGPGASLEHQLRCRKFGPWEGERGPVLRFRSTVLKCDSRVRGMVSLGAIVGEHSFVDKRAVVAEGAIVPACVKASGNPAFISGDKARRDSNGCRSLLLGALKLLWLAAELYIFFGTLLVGQLLVNAVLPADWRYTPLCYWILLLTTSSVTLLIVGVALKWILIGRRRPQKLTGTLWRAAADWAADYHFRISTSLLTSISSGSSMWNFVLVMYGMDIDFCSKVYVDSFPPSKVDLISVKRSFVSIAAFDVKREDGEYCRTAINACSLGYNVHVGPGVTLSNAVVNPLLFVKEDLVRDKPDARYQGIQAKDLTQLKISVELCYLFFLPFLWASFLPAYELFKSSLEPESAEWAVLIVALALIVQTVSWLILLRILQSAQFGFGCLSRPFIPLYVVYLTASWAIQNWSMLPLLWGTPFFNHVALFLGTSVEGRAFYFGLSLHDFFDTILADKTVVDGAFSCAHNLVFGDFEFGPNRLAGVHHEFTFSSNNNTSASESGPWRTLIGKVSRESDSKPKTHSLEVYTGAVKGADTEAEGISDEISV